MSLFTMSMLIWGKLFKAKEIHTLLWSGAFAPKYFAFVIISDVSNSFGKQNYIATTIFKAIVLNVLSFLSGIDTFASNPQRAIQGAVWMNIRLWFPFLTTNANGLMNNPKTYWSIL